VFVASGKVRDILANDRYPVGFLMSNLTITQRMGGTYLRKFGTDFIFIFVILTMARFERLTCLATPCASSVDESLDADSEGCGSQNARVNES
jgi:hypothetical protein